jgi:peptidyl-prolyl cis-trans isomerase C
MGATTPTAVSVNGVTIPRDAIAREAQHHPAPKPVAAWKSAAQALIIRELLLQRALAIGILPAPSCDSRGRRETEEEALIRGLIEQEVTTPEPDDETCRRYYRQNRRRFRSEGGTELPYEAVAGRIAEYLRENVTRRALAQYVARLVSAADIAGIELLGAEMHRVN